ncbi:MAG TPA: hypothetical protein PLH19_15900 [Anaerolineae bacterium]|mgnify:CR=1 FL=1|nr:hypothetical protein [Anaerolineae bacterium]HQH39996.1 hypothetical protein [Anaerolineae bacterium]
MTRRLQWKWIVLAVAVLLLIPTVVWAFNGSYSPTGHWVGVYEHTSYSCPGTTNSGGNVRSDDIVEIRTTMNWDTAHANSVKDYSRNGGYYTHDITDMSDTLNGWCLWTNFPSPYYDWDDDDNDGKWEETEVVAQDTAFPVVSQYYSVNSYFTRWHWVCTKKNGEWDCAWVYESGGGNVAITPAISKWQGWPYYEYQTLHYDGDPVNVSYGNNPLQTMEVESSVMVPEAVTVDADLPYTFSVEVAAVQNLKARLNVPVGMEALSDYQAWSLSLAPAMQAAGLDSSDVVITFRQPLSPVEFDAFLKEHAVDVSVVRAEYQVADETGAMQTWTTYVRNLPGTDFLLLDEAARNAVGADLNVQHGAVALYGAVPLSQLAALNGDSRVFLADSAPGYIASLLSDQAEVQEILGKLREEMRESLREEVLASAEAMPPDALASLDVDREVERFFELYPDRAPRVIVSVPDLWMAVRDSTPKN